MSPFRVSVGVVGMGYWGPNIARTLAAIPSADIRWICDTDPLVRAEAAARYPDTRVSDDLADLLRDPALDAVLIATPSSTHVRLARRALEAGKHVFVEKPLANDERDAASLVEFAADCGLRLMVGHVLLFHPAVMKLRELVETGRLGDLYYLYGNRQNLGRVRTDENALWSLGAQDVSVLLYLLSELPISVSARGQSYLRPGVADVVFCFLTFKSGVTAHLHLSWLDPQKLRRLTVVGSQRMAVFDDMETERKLTVYEKASPPPTTGDYGEYLQARFGDIVSPRIDNAEPLRVELEYFLGAVSDPRLPLGTERAVAVVRVLAALQASLDRGGASIRAGMNPGSKLMSVVR